MRIVAFSDTHGHHNDLTVPDGDLLIFAGDFMTDGYRASELYSFSHFMKKQPHQHKIWIAGNHDRMVESHRNQAVSLFSGCTYLENTSCFVEDRKIWGTPWTPFFLNWAFNGLPKKMHDIWKIVPGDIDILVTHGPPESILDEVVTNNRIKHVGCPFLYHELGRIQPVIHIFGHIHGAYGQRLGERLDTDYYNVSVCNERYELAHPCTVIDL